MSKDFADRILTYCKLKGIKDMDMRVKCGFTNASWSMWLNHPSRFPKMMYTEKIFQFFDINRDYLLAGKGAPINKSESERNSSMSNTAGMDESDMAVKIVTDRERAIFWQVKAEFLEENYKLAKQEIAKINDRFQTIIRDNIEVMRRCEESQHTQATRSDRHGQKSPY